MADFGACVAAFGLEVTPSKRSLARPRVSGDVGADDAFRTAALGRSDTKAWGSQVELELRINEVFATATLTLLSGNIPGLTGGQFVVAIGFRGGIDLGKEIPAPGAQAPPGT